MRTMRASLPVLLACLSPLAAQDLDGDQLRDVLSDKAADFWVYDDLESAIATAKQTGKPLLISFRCVP